MGFGIGIIAGASMLQLITFAQDQEQSLMVADGPKTYTQQELDDAVAKAREETGSTPLPLPSASDPASASGPRDGAAMLPAPNASDAASSGLAATETPPPSPTDAEETSSPSESAAEKVSFYVNPGMSLKTVARSLMRLGLIDDADDFIDEARPYSKEIQPGTSVFTGKPTYREIIAELTRKKED